MQEKCDALRKEKMEEQHKFQAALEEKVNELKELRSSCNEKEDIIIRVSKKLATKEHQKEKLSQNLSFVSSKIETANSKLDQFEEKRKEILRETRLLYEMVMEYCKLNESEDSSDNNQHYENNNHEIPEPTQTINLLRFSLELLKEHTSNVNGTSSKLKEQPAKSENNHQKASIEITELKQNVRRLEGENENLQKKCESLRNSLEKSQERLRRTNAENDSLQKEIHRQQDVETKLEGKIEEMKDEYLAICTEMGVIDRKRLSLEELLSRVESERDSLTKEITTEGEGRKPSTRQ